MLTRRRIVRTALWMPPALWLVTACSGARSGVTVTFDHSPPVPLGELMTFTLNATSVWDAPNPDPNGTKITEAEFGLLLTDGLELLSSGWTGQVLRPGTTSYSRATTFKANQPQSVEFQVKLNVAGFNIVGASAEVANNPGFVNSGQSAFYLKVTEDGTQIQRDPFPEQRASPTPAS